MTTLAAMSYSHNGLVGSWIHSNKTNEQESSLYSRVSSLLLKGLEKTYKGN